MIWNEILCLGDSITCGARDKYGRSYPMELAKILTEKTGEVYVCHDHGICGETSSDLLRRAWDAANSRKEAKIALLMIGTNDTQKEIPLKIYEDNIRQTINILRIHGKHVVVATLPQLGFTPLYFKSSALIGKYNEIIKKLSAEMDYIVCDMSGTEKYYVDGVHYTHEGYVELAKRWCKTILNSQS
jgi:lysophospholipase L1-like esterase